MFLKNWWYVAATTDELGRSLTQRWILNEPVVMYRTGAGEPVALHDRCPHRSLPLSRGELVGDDICCGYHGMTFDPAGSCVAIPGYSTPPGGIRVHRYPLLEKWGWVWIWMGDPALADESRLPDFHWAEKAGWTPCPGYIRFEAHYQLVVDNLLDLSHEAFVHRATIGNAAVAETPVETAHDGADVKVSRVMRDCPPPPLFARVRGYDGNIDRHQYVRFTPPSFINIDVRAYPSGTEDPERALIWRVLNALTPETESSTHYFWNMPRYFAPEPAITQLLHKAVTDTFEEDRAVLGAQQAMIDHDPVFTHVNIRADAGAILARRTVDALLAEESAERAAE